MMRPITSSSLFPLQTSPPDGGHSRLKGATAAAPRVSDLGPPPPDTSELSAQAIAQDTPETSSTDAALPASITPPKHSPTSTRRFSARGLRRSGSAETHRTRAFESIIPECDDRRRPERHDQSRDIAVPQKDQKNRKSEIMKRYRAARVRIAAVLREKATTLTLRASALTTKFRTEQNSTTPEFQTIHSTLFEYTPRVTPPKQTQRGLDPTKRTVNNGQARRR